MSGFRRTRRGGGNAQDQIERLDATFDAAAATLRQQGLRVRPGVRFADVRGEVHVGDVQLAGMTREQARTELTTRLRPYFTHPHVTIGVQEYVSNQVTVLGRVESPGRQRFDHPPTLAEVLANAGALPILDKQATLTRCAIMRGRNKLIWVDLKALLNGDLADTNTAAIARRLFTESLPVQEAATTGDREADIAAALQRLAASHDAVVVTGGLGPTEDDRTAKAAAIACKRPLVLNDRALQQIRERFRSMQRRMHPANEKQAMLTRLNKIPISPSPKRVLSVDFKIIFRASRSSSTL